MLKYVKILQTAFIGRYLMIWERQKPDFIKIIMAFFRNNFWDSRAKYLKIVGIKNKKL